MVKNKTKTKAETKTSVRSYQQDIKEKKQKFAAYSKKMAINVATFQSDIKPKKGEFKKAAKDIKVAGQKMREQGIKRMRQKVEGFKEEIRNQIKKNKEAVSKIGAGVKFLISEIDKKKSDFQAYSHGPFKDYINEFWGK